MLSELLWTYSEVVMSNHKISLNVTQFDWNTKLCTSLSVLAWRLSGWMTDFDFSGRKRSERDQKERTDELARRKERGLDEEIGGGRRDGEKTETVTVEKGQQRQRASVREKMKNRQTRWKYVSFLGEELPCGAVEFNHADLWSKDDKDQPALHTQSNFQYCCLATLCFDFICKLFCFTQTLSPDRKNKVSSDKQSCAAALENLWAASEMLPLSIHPFLSSSPLKEATSSPAFSPPPNSSSELPPLSSLKLPYARSISIS